MCLTAICLITLYITWCVGVSKGYIAMKYMIYLIITCHVTLLNTAHTDIICRHTRHSLAYLLIFLQDLLCLLLDFEKFALS